VVEDRALRTYIWPVIQALLFHLVIVALFLYNWSAAPKASVTPPPVIINAKILTLSEPAPAKPKAEQSKADKDKQQKIKEEQKRKDLARKKAELAEKEQRLLEKQRQKEERRKQLARKKAENEKALLEQKEREKKQREEALKKAEELARQKEQLLRQQALEDQLALEREYELGSALAAEADYLQVQQDAEAAQSYVGLIRERVKQNWHRPLSARNGMETILVIHLVPTGEVNNVYVKTSSGDAAFDRSAIQAVQRAEKFEELQQLSPSAFDAHFRQFNFIFRPEDLAK